MSEADSSEAEIRWAAATQIFYTNPLLQALALFKAGGDPVQAAVVLDGIFGITERSADQAMGRTHHWPPQSEHQSRINKSGNPND
jgi:hypothetical protein